MIKSVRRFGGKTATRLGLGLLLPVSVMIVAPATLASAHEGLEGIAFSDSGCDWDYVGDDVPAVVLDQRSVISRDPLRDQYGEVFLLWNPIRGENCVITKRYWGHGSAAPMSAALAVRNPANGNTVYYSDYGSYGHYAAVAAPARNRCVAFSGTVELNGTFAWGGRNAFGNCG